MAYSIGSYFLGSNVEIEISETEFQEILAAKGKLLAALRIEEKFDLLLGNYAEFEKELLDAALSHALHFDSEWSAEMDRLNAINRRLVNLLSACRLYFDQMHHALSALYGKPSLICDAFETMRHAEYDQFLGYRAMEALRNYVQHQELPLTQIGATAWRNTTRTQDGEVSLGTLLRHATVVQLSVESLRGSKFQSAVLKQLENMSDAKGRVDVRPLVREYVSCIAKIHVSLRTLMETDVAQAEDVVDGCINRLAYDSGKSVSDAALVRTGDTGRIVEEIYLGRRFGERRRGLKQKNRELNNLVHWVISNEVRADG